MEYVMKVKRLLIVHKIVKMSYQGATVLMMKAVKKISIIKLNKKIT